MFEYLRGELCQSKHCGSLRFNGESRWKKKIFGICALEDLIFEPFSTFCGLRIVCRTQRGCCTDNLNQTHHKELSLAIYSHLHSVKNSGGSVLFNEARLGVFEAARLSDQNSDALCLFLPLLFLLLCFLHRSLLANRLSHPVHLETNSLQTVQTTLSTVERTPSDDCCDTYQIQTQ